MKPRKKRNFKNLTLPDSPITKPTETKPKDDDWQDNTPLTVGLGTFDISVELRLDLRSEDFETLDELGRGNGGTVLKVMHRKTQTVMACKMIYVQANNAVRKQIMRELQFMHDCHSKHIVSFYGAFIKGGDISICMEYMELGQAINMDYNMCFSYRSLDTIYKKHGPIEILVLNKITYAVLDGLIYLYDTHRIIHRDLKPSNVLVNAHGQIKLCDFGVSGQLINSVADTFVGTSSYMSPERIMGSPYSVKSDVWSLGMTVMELALGRFPFPSDGRPLSIFELLQHIVHEPVPSLPVQPDKYPPEVVSFCKAW
ncbi:kinase-like domain-containing protein [Phycomyces blakesleeanus]|uniref:Kinase-like domain-containing protein n=1 Tax=Phycomyces blakesleeanus TaxID=4837 RepID=A0ABR3ARN9_PHYBL